MSFAKFCLLCVLCLGWYNGPGYCQEPELILHGNDQLLPGEQMTCTFSEFVTVTIEWFRDGQPLTKVAGNITISGAPTSSTLTLITDDAVVSGNYTCRATTQEEVYEKSIIATKAAYSLTVQGDSVVGEGSNLSLVCNFTSVREVESYRWDSTTGVSRMGQVLQISNVTASHTGEYTCLVQLNSFHVLTIMTDVIVQTFPTNNAATVSSIVEKGSDILLVCNITGAGLEYRWSFNGNAVKESGRRVLQNESLVIMRAQFSDAGSYVCTASNLAGSASQQHYLTVFGSPDIIPPDSTIVDVAINRQASLFCRSVSYPGSNTSWVHYPVSGTGTGLSVPGSNTRLSVASSEELVITSADKEDAGTFMCNVTNEHGSATFNITLVVVGNPLPPTAILVRTQLTSANISWTQPMPSEYYRVERYVVELSENDGPFIDWQESNEVISRDTRFLQLTGLKPATKYQLRMWSGNLAGISNVSNTSFTTLSNIPELDFSHSLSADNLSLVLNWRLLYDGGSPINNFHISVVSTNEAERIFHPSIDDNQLVVDSLIPSTQYTITVWLGNEGGGNTSVTLNVRTPPIPQEVAVLTTTTIIIATVVPSVTVILLLSVAMCIVICAKKLRVKKKGYPINPVPPSESFDAVQSTPTSHSQTQHLNGSYQNHSSGRSLTSPRLVVSELQLNSASLARDGSISMYDHAHSHSSNGHVPHYFSPISVENDSPKFSSLGGHVRQTSSNFSLPMSAVPHEETYV